MDYTVEVFYQTEEDTLPVIETVTLDTSSITGDNKNEEILNLIADTLQKTDKYKDKIDFTIRVRL
ncbi:hypothetical protein OXC43_gp29 [Klebsiella phage vB_KpP_FBKp27]|uniref:Uncharacterized protein n=1 Tax=Klebsiella phage vB_KpP_FBKp27 TaxID=2801837 RepID=A0A7U0J507_9CAUD|nr:hypothetical protein OXC43_gp29 [Klebsiella phage vB_KpP_FBKp27]QQV91679.1 hypothetical protein vBKpPFBKp27_090 [Klebsiella phage vB_KpP_FBKp27]